MRVGAGGVAQSMTGEEDLCCAPEKAILLLEDYPTTGRFVCEVSVNLAKYLCSASVESHVCSY